MYIFILLFLSTSAFAGVIPNNGMCPSGYTTRGEYCYQDAGAPTMIEKVGKSCPTGYTYRGNYCKSPDESLDTIKKNKTCPGGYTSRGDYCTK